MVVINEDYWSVFNVNFGKYWSLLYKLAEKQQIAQNKSFFYYFNSNPNNPLYRNHGYKKTKILKYDGAATIIPNIKIRLITEKTLSQRKNKAA